MPRGVVSFTQKRDEPGLLEIPIVGQRFGYPPFFHQKKARAVGNAPPLIQPRSISLDRSHKLRTGLGDDFHPVIILKLPHRIRGESAPVRTHSTHEVEKFDKNHLGCNYPARA